MSEPGKLRPPREILAEAIAHERQRIQRATEKAREAAGSAAWLTDALIDAERAATSADLTELAATLGRLYEQACDLNAVALRIHARLAGLAALPDLALAINEYEHENAKGCPHDCENGRIVTGVGTLTEIEPCPFCVKL